jgi:hypothetical protein
LPFYQFDFDLDCCCCCCCKFFATLIHWLTQYFFSVAERKSCKSYHARASKKNSTLWMFQFSFSSDSKKSRETIFFFRSCMRVCPSSIYIRTTIHKKN